MSKTNCYVIKQILKIKSPFDNIALVMLFVFLEICVGEKVCESTCNVV